MDREGCTKEVQERSEWRSSCQQNQAFRSNGYFPLESERAHKSPRSGKVLVAEEDARALSRGSYLEVREQRNDYTKDDAVGNKDMRNMLALSTSGQSPCSARLYKLRKTPKQKISILFPKPVRDERT